VGPGAVAGPLTGLFVSWFCTKLAASVARINERTCLHCAPRAPTSFHLLCDECPLALALSQAGKLYPVNVAGYSAESLLGWLRLWGHILAVNARCDAAWTGFARRAEAPH
jgi:hypothetical protein